MLKRRVRGKKVDRELRPVEPTRCVVPARRGRRQPHAHRGHRRSSRARRPATRMWSTWCGASSRSFPATGRWSGSCPSTWAGRCGWTTLISTSTTTSATPPSPPRAARPSCAALVGRVMAQQLDRSKPLWEIWMVEGLGGGRWALLSKTHHALVDGVSGTDLLAVIMDTTPQPSAPVADDWATPARTERRQLGARGRQPTWPGAPTSSSGPSGPAPASPRNALARAGEVARGLSSMAGLDPSHADLEPQRPARPAPPLRLGRDDGGRHQARSARASAVPSTTSSWPRSPTAFANCSAPGASRSTGWCARSSRCRSGPAAPEPWRSVTAPSQNKVSAMFAALPVGHRRPGRAPAGHHPPDGRASRSPKRPWPARR